MMGGVVKIDISRYAPSEHVVRLVDTINEEIMRVGKNKLKMSSGEVRKFGSQVKRDNFERVVQAIKHGFRPGKKRKKKS